MYMSDYVSPLTVWQTQDLFTQRYLFKYLMHVMHQASEVHYGRMHQSESLIAGLTHHICLSVRRR